MRPIQAALAAATACLVGCSGKAPDPTMTLLREGDAKVCVASDIEDTLRRLILPDGNAQAAKDYVISFDKTTLESFDKAVGKAQCNTYVKIDGPNGALIDPTPVDYAITPSAQNPDTFLVSGPTVALRQQLVSDLETRVGLAESQAGEQAAAAALEALVKPGWLMGRWVDATAGSDACITGPYFEFGRKNVVETENGSARWSMAGMQVTVTGSARTLRLAITDADTNEFTATYDDGEIARHRRCTRPEMQAAAAAQRADEEAAMIEGNIELEAAALPDLTQEQ